MGHFRIADGSVVAAHCSGIALGQVVIKQAEQAESEISLLVSVSSP